MRRAAMTAALALSIAPEAVQSEALRERVQVLESRPGVREVLLVTEAMAPAALDRYGWVGIPARLSRWPCTAAEMGLFECPSCAESAAYARFVTLAVQNSG